MKKKILKTVHLSKNYGSTTILDDVNLSIEKGDIYGLIGRNGAGKTTLMRLLTSLAIPSEGEVFWFGQLGKEGQYNMDRIGSMIENPAFFPNLSAYDNLDYYRIQKGITDKKEITRVLEQVHLENVGKKKYKNFSLGMKQRLGIALAILNHPDFIILDEPINGLDPLGISEIRETIKRLNEEENITILISSHILPELYLVATKFGFLEHGHIIKELTKEELDFACNRCLEIKVNDAKKAALVLEQQFKTDQYKIINEHELRLYDLLKEASKINKAMLESGIELYSLSEIGISLEDYFVSILKEEQR